MTGSPLKEQKSRGASPPVPERISEYPQDARACPQTSYWLNWVCEGFTGGEELV